MEKVKVRIEFDFERSYLCNIADNVLQQLGEEAMTEEQIIDRFCGDQIHVIPTDIVDDLMRRDGKSKMLQFFLASIIYGQINEQSHDNSEAKEEEEKKCTE